MEAIEFYDESKILFLDFNERRTYSDLNVTLKFGGERSGQFAFRFSLPQDYRESILRSEICQEIANTLSARLIAEKWGRKIKIHLTSPSMAGLEKTLLQVEKIQFELVPLGIQGELFWGELPSSAMNKEELPWITSSVL